MNILRSIAMCYPLKQNGEMLCGKIFPAYWQVLSSQVNFCNAKRELSAINHVRSTPFLTPRIPVLNLVCGMKMKGRPKRRCRDCYFVVRQERLYVMCKTHPRHKQMAVQAPEWRSWILTSVSQGGVKPF